MSDPDDHPPVGPAPFPDPIPTVIDFGTVNILAGAPGVGKTTLFAEWCARFRDGRSICGHATHPPTRLYYLSTDRGGASTQKLLDLHDLTAGDWTIYYNPLDDASFDRKLMRNPLQALDTLRWCLQQFNPAILPGSHLVLDPAAPLFVPGSQNDPRSVAALLWELHVIAREYLITVFLLAHFSKQLADASQRYTRPQDRISGSGAWSGFSDTQMYMVDPEPPSAPYHTVGWNPRHSAPEEFRFVRDGAVFIPYKALEDVGLIYSLPESTKGLFRLIAETAKQHGSTDSDGLQAAAATFLGMARSTYFYQLKKLEAKGVIERPFGRVVLTIRPEQVRFVPDSESDHKTN